jgi:hypothetical protein
MTLVVSDPVAHVLRHAIPQCGNLVNNIFASPAIIIVFGKPLKLTPILGCLEAEEM